MRMGYLGTRMDVFMVLAFTVVNIFTATAQSDADPCSTYSTCTTRPLGGKWYRFDPDGVGQAVTACPTGTECGTGRHVWINGTLPAISEGESSVISCLTSGSDCCTQSQTITVKQCPPGFFVYKIGNLPSCSAMCLNGSAIMPTESPTGVRNKNSTDITTEQDTTLEQTSPASTASMKLGTALKTRSASTVQPVTTSKENPFASTAFTSTIAVTELNEVTPAIDPCRSYQNLTDWFTMINDTDMPRRVRVQNSQQPGWYRFPYTKTGQITTSCPRDGQCGLGNNVWVKDTTCIKGTTDMTSVQLCLQTNKSCCDQTTSTKQKYCGGFLVYYLPYLVPGSTICYEQDEVTSVIDPCRSYQNLTDWFTMINDTGIPRHAQNSRQIEWYRFPYTSTGQMTTSCPSDGQCGLGKNVWVNDTTCIKDTTGITSVQLCLQTNKSCCEQTTSTRQKNCGGFLVYFLPNLVPGSTFCYDNSNPFEKTTTTAVYEQEIHDTSTKSSVPVTKPTPVITTSPSELSVENKSSSKLSTEVTIAIVCSGVIVVGFIIAIFIVKYCRRR